MIELFYGALVIIVGFIALHSHCELTQKVMATLFVGWLIYVNAERFSSFAERVELNLYLDLAQLGFVSLTYFSWRECKQSALCHWVCGVFAAMISLHIIQISTQFNLYWYYLACNVLFVVQMLAVIYFSRLGYIDYITNEANKWRKTTGSESRNLRVVQIHKKSA